MKAETKTRLQTAVVIAIIVAAMVFLVSVGRPAEDLESALPIPISLEEYMAKGKMCFAYADSPDNDPGYALFCVRPDLIEWTVIRTDGSVIIGRGDFMEHIETQGKD